MAGTNSVGLIGVYRRRNARYVRALTEVARAAGWAVAWWALDDVDDALAAYTVGAGPGQRLELLNEVLSRTGLSDGWLVVSDDDVVFTRGDLVALLATCEEAGLHLAQPARSDDNTHHEFNVAHPITRARQMSRVRATTFVEIGPLFVVAPHWRERIVPFPTARGMGWGLELDWFDLQREGCRLGIVDCIRVEHTGEPGSDYDFASEADRMHQELAGRGFAGWRDVQKDLAIWRPWQRVAPWLDKVS